MTRKAVVALSEMPRLSLGKPELSIVSADTGPLQALAVYSIYCKIGVPCVNAPHKSPIIRYCSPPGALPTTTAFGYGSWPPGGCVNGQICCPNRSPTPGKFLFDSGSTAILSCATLEFAYTATTALPASATPSQSNIILPSQSDSSSSGGGNSGNSGSTNGDSNINNINAFSVGSGSGLSTSDKIGIGVGVPSAIFGLVGAYYAWKQYQKRKLAAANNDRIEAGEFGSTDAPTRRDTPMAPMPR
ncbi:hypothetical protein GP486_000630 [Trichoglossum hirsutum]|uniref:Uncharacterized protein n=1 Tax=Trichoglossum hirsutum TaxID=265104 RepID=A0A9P8LII5_9PEZI|nr:hypothetical protein GP486_000630 [Trichoglossum hirsutum]